MSLFFLTWSDDPASEKLDNLRKSLEAELLVMPYDKELGNISKIVKTKEYLESANNITDNDVIVLLDGYDQICIKNDMSKLLADFKETGQEILISVEAAMSFPNRELLPIYNTRNKQYAKKYPNSGAQIGYKGAYLRMLCYIVENLGTLYPMNVNKSDQMILRKFFLDNLTLNLVKCEIDYNEVFFTCYTVADKLVTVPKHTCYFVHVLRIIIPSQREKYDKLVDYYLVKKLHLTS